jgi:hypothetical protein
MYLKNVAAIAQRIETLISHWRKDRGTGADDKRSDGLEKLRKDLIVQMSSIEENWDKVMNNVGWFWTDTVEEKKTIARTV